MAKPVRQPVTLNHLANLVERGFADVRTELSKINSELSKKADKTDVDDLKNDIGHLAKASKLGFDELHQILGAKASKTDLRQGEDRIKQRLSHIDNRLDILATHEKRLVKVEKLVGLEV